jgi:glycosyltransferase involved in cell wall biosynthesis
MKIAFLLTQSLDSPGGLGRYGPIAHELSKLGHQVRLFALNPDPSNIHPDHKIEGVDVSYVGMMHVIKQGNVKTYYSARKLLPLVLRSTLALTTSALKTDADIIYVCKAQPMNGIAGMVTHYLKGKMLVVDCDDYEAASGNFSSAWQKSLVAFFEKRLPRTARLVTTNTRFMTDLLIEWGISPSRIFYLPNGVDVARFQNIDRERINDLRAKYNLQNKRVVTFIGSLDLASHPIELLLQAFNHLQKRVPDCVLLLVGGGESYEMIRGLLDGLSISDITRMTGRVAADDIPLYYALSDITVDPVYDNEVAKSRAPLKLFESWASGIPFVTADVGDRRYLLGNPPAGLLASPGNPSSLADCLFKILVDPVLGAEFSRRGYAEVQKFTYTKISASLDEALNLLVTNPEINQA